MADLRHAGTHWPTGGEHPSVEAILALPGPRSGGPLVILADSARYHYDRARQAVSGPVIWRALPRLGRRPAELGYNAVAVADECLNLWDEQPHGGTEWFQPLNELQFSDELGGPFTGFGSIAYFLRELRVELRQRFKGLGQNVRLIFPPWCPDQPWMDAPFDQADEWVFEAEWWDGVAAHVYSHVVYNPDHFGAANVLRTHARLRSILPDALLVYTEWNANHTGADEREMLEAAAQVCADDPDCLGYSYYIWQTQRPGEQDLSVWGNDARSTLFANPPQAPAPLPGPVPDPVPEPAPEPVPAPAPEPPPEDPMADAPRGLDVASYQGYPDWGQVAEDGYAFAFTKATEGTGYQNPTFVHNWQGIKAAGMRRGAYHFAQPDHNLPEAEAAYFVETVRAQGLEEGDLLMLDLEVGFGDLGQWTLRWLRAVEAAVGFKPLVYTGEWFSEPHGLGDRLELADYGLVLAAYQAAMPAPPRPWTVVAFWQFTDRLSVPGINGPVDGDYFNGTVERIPLYGKPAAPAPAPDVDPVQAELQKLRNLVGNAYHEDGQLVPPLERIATGKAADGHRLTKAEMQAEAHGLLGFLRANQP